MRCAMLAFMAVFLFVLTGCATLITKPLSESSKIEENKGISYSLPKRLHKVHLAATPISKALEEIKKKLESAATLKTEANKKRDAANEAREKAATAYKTAKKLDDGTPAFKKKLGELEADLATKTFEYKLMLELAGEAALAYEELANAAVTLSERLEETTKKLQIAYALKTEADNNLVKAQEARAMAEKAYETAKRLDDGTTAYKKKLADLEAALKAATDKRDLMVELSNEANLAYSQLINEFTDLTAKKVISIKIEPQDPVADEKNQLIAKPRHMMTRDDTWDLTTDAQGLLTSADSTSVDRTGDIVLKIAQTIGAIMGYIPPVTVEKGLYGPEIKIEECKGVFDEATMKEVEYLVDFSKREDIWRVDNWLCHWGYKIEVSGYKDIYSRPTVEAWEDYIKDTKFSKPLELGSSGVGGLVYRRELPYKVQVCKATENEKECILPLAVFNIQMPNLSPYSVVEFNASVFTTTKNTVKFDKGFLISSHQERPSELLGFVSLPAEFSKSYFSMLTEIISLKINYSTKEAEYLNALGKEIDAEKALKQKQMGN